MVMVTTLLFKRAMPVVLLTKLEAIFICMQAVLLVLVEIRGKYIFSVVKVTMIIVLNFVLPPTEMSFWRTTAPLIALMSVWALMLLVPGFMLWNPAATLCQLLAAH